MMLLGISAASIALLIVGVWLYFIAPKKGKRKALAKALEKERHDVMMGKAVTRLQAELKEFREKYQEDMN